MYTLIWLLTVLLVLICSGTWAHEHSSRGSHEYTISIASEHTSTRTRAHEHRGAHTSTLALTQLRKAIPADGFVLFSLFEKENKRRDDQEKTIAEKFDQLRTTAIPPDGVVLKKRRLNRISRQNY